MRVVWTTEAADDLEGIRDYIALDRPPLEEVTDHVQVLRILHGAQRGAPSLAEQQIIV